MKTPPPWNGSTLLIEAHAVKVVRGERVLVQSVDFGLSSGGCVLVLGENGAGKSTLLRMIAGLLPVGGGRLVWPFLPQGTDEATTFVHYIGHKDGLKETLTLNENMRLWVHLMGGNGAAPNQNAVLERVGLAALSNVPAGLLSAGQRRRLAFARLLLAPRPLWILDEPATALDAGGMVLLADLVREHRAAGGGIIAATHTPLDWAPDFTLTLQNKACLRGEAA